MYPYLEPHGVIMKINRQPLAELPADVLARDRDYWRQIMAETLGNMLSSPGAGTDLVYRDPWNNPYVISLDRNGDGPTRDDKTSVSNLAASLERIYVQHDLRGFTGDPAFVENHYAKAMLSKLRSSIAGIYTWRLANPPAEYQPKTKAAQQLLAQQADLALRQAFALCPYSPEAVFRYVAFLIQLGRIEDARLVAQTALHIHTGLAPLKDPGRDAAERNLKDLLQNLQKMQSP
jgi:hypothetical protein